MRRIAMLGCVATIWIPATGFAQQAAPRPIAQGENAFEYCGRVGTVDDPGHVPVSLLPAFQKAFGPMATMGAHFRCYQGTVMGCFVGANLNCAKADVTRTSVGGDEWCRANPNDQNVPMAATGHSTIYTWRCAGTRAVPVRKFSPVDDRGFEITNWKVLN